MCLILTQLGAVILVIRPAGWLPSPADDVRIFSVIQLPRSNYKQMPWKNGLGLTNEIDRFPAGSEPFLWRLSQAHVSSDAPFSQFPGYDRWLCVWQGEAIFLNDFKLEPLSPHRFSGDAPMDCKLSNSAVEDVGLIYDRSKITADMRVIEGEFQLSSSGTHYLFDLSSGDTAKIEGPGPTELSVKKSLLVSVSRRA